MIMAEGVGRRAVEGHGRADAHPADHEAHLVDDGVGQDAAHIVLEQGVHDAVDAHETADDDEDLPARIGADERVDGGLGGVGREDDDARDRGLGIGVRQPGVQGRGRRVDQDARQDEPVGQAAFGHGRRRIVHGAGLADVHDDAGQEDEPAHEVDEHVAETGADGLVRAPGQDEEGGGHGHHFPVEIERDDVAGEDHAQGRADIGQGRASAAGRRADRRRRGRPRRRSG